MVFLGYMAMYLMRNNFKAAQPLLKEQLDFTTTELGLIGLAFSLTYGLGKTVLGYYIDGKNTKKLLSFALILSSICVLLMGMVMSYLGSHIGFLIVLWGLNGVFQCIGGPASYSTLTRWTPRDKRGKYLGFWNTSHNIGGGLAGAIALWGAYTLFDGSVIGMFIFPAVIAMIFGVIGFFLGKDEPQELGWARAEEIFGEPVEEEDQQTESQQMSKWQIFTTYVLRNPWIWLLCLANIFVYIIRIGIDNWAPLYVSEQLNFSRGDAVNTIFYFEVGALIASLLWGYVSDLLHGRRAIVAVFCLVLIVFALLGYRHATTVTMINISLVALGLLIFGPQILITISLVGFAPKNAVSVTTGMSGTFAYLIGDSIAKVALARIADPTKSGLNLFGHQLHGWHDVFVIFYISVALGIVLMGMVAWGEERKIRRLRQQESDQTLVPANG